MTEEKRIYVIVAETVQTDLLGLTSVDKPARTLMVGDKPADILAGRGAGAHTAAVTYGYGDLDSLTAASPDFTSAS